MRYGKALTVQNASMSVPLRAHGDSRYAEISSVGVWVCGVLSSSELSIPYSASNMECGAEDDRTDWVAEETGGS